MKLETQLYLVHQSALGWCIGFYKTSNNEVKFVPIRSFGHNHEQATKFAENFVKENKDYKW